MVDFDMDSKNNSVAGQALDICLKLVVPEYSDSILPWNKYKTFLMFMKERGAKDILFSYMDKMLCCLSRAAAMLLYHCPTCVGSLHTTPVSTTTWLVL